jgi:hypothetical protein
MNRKEQRENNVKHLRNHLLGLKNISKNVQKEMSLNAIILFLLIRFECR